MDRDVFAESIVFTDFDTGFGLRIKMQILGICSNHRAPTDASAAGDGDTALNQSMASNFAILRNGYRTFDHRERPNAHALGDVGFRRNQCGGMDQGSLQSGFSVAQICEWKSRKIGNSQTDCILTLKIAPD